jgi:hypothetical protein
VAGDSSSSLSKLLERETSHANEANPASTCKSKRNASDFSASHSDQTFTEFYETNRGRGRGAGSNAFGKCVSAIAKHKERSGEAAAENHGEDKAENRGKGSANPAMACKSMQATNVPRFETTYGTRPNAFGKCVSEHAKGKKD